MNVLEVKQLQIMREQRVIIDNLSFELPWRPSSFFYKAILVVGNQRYYIAY